MLKNQRIEGEKSFRERNAAWRAESVAVFCINEDSGAVEPEESRVFAAGNIAGKVRLNAALAEQRSTEMSGRR